MLKVSPTKILNKFGIEDYTDDMVNLMVRRVYDIAGTTDKTLNVYYNQIFHASRFFIFNI